MENPVPKPAEPVLPTLPTLFIFLSTISRLPLPAERQVALDALNKDRVEGAQNLQWALLNLVEFL